MSSTVPKLGLPPPRCPPPPTSRDNTPSVRVWREPSGCGRTPAGGRGVNRGHVIVHWCTLPAHLRALLVPWVFLCLSTRQYTLAPHARNIQVRIQRQQ
jgi:hypothetical protein